MSEDNFKARPGRTRNNTSPGERKYLHCVLHAAARAGMPMGPSHASRPSRLFNGSHLGRGSVAARALAMPGRYAGLRARRAIVKVNIVRFGKNGLRGASGHLRYLERGAFTRDGREGSLYSAGDDKADRKQFLDPCREDRHQFRLIVSIEDAAEYEELRPLIRRFMARMDEDLGTRLEWVAADHFDTLHPHSHIVLRGKDDEGENLILSPEYMYGGMRHRLSEMIAIDLGPRTDLETERRRSMDVQAERVTQIDRDLIAQMNKDRIVSAGGRDMFEHALRTGRLRKLGSLGLAQDLGQGRWKLEDQMGTTLGELGARADAIRRLQSALSAAGIERALSELVIDQPDRFASISGRLLSHGCEEGRSDRQYLVIDGTDGRCHYIEIGRDDALAGISKGAVIQVDPPVRVQLLSAVPLERLSNYNGATWLDRELIAPGTHLRDSGFGREVRFALVQRRAWLIGQKLAFRIGEQVTYRPDMLAVLEQRELQEAARKLSIETGLDFSPAQPGAIIEGVFRSRLELASGRFAMIETGLRFTLVPWQPELELGWNRAVSGIVGRNRIHWSFGRERALDL